MSRVKIAFPNQDPIYNYPIKIRVTDINYGNHLANDALVGFLHEARVAFLQSEGYTEFNLEGVSLIQGDLMVKYQSEAFLADVIDCEIYQDNFGKRSFDMLYKLKCTRENIVVPIAEAKVGLVCFDYEARKTVDIPEAFRAKFELHLT